MRAAWRVSPRASFATIVLTIGLFLTGLTAYFAYRSSSLSAEFHFQNLAEEVRSGIDLKNQLYLSALQQTRGLIQVNPTLSRHDFKRYTDNMNLPVEYPGIMGIGFIQALPTSLRGIFERRIRDDYANPELKFWRLNNNDLSDTMSVVRFFEPEMAPVNGRYVIGLDVQSEPSRRASLELARDSGKPVISGRLHLVQDPSHEHPGYLYLVPIYKAGVTVETVEQRRQNHIGFVYSAFRARDLFNGIIRPDWLERNRVDFEIYDGITTEGTKPNPANLLFSHDEGGQNHGNRTATFQFEMGSRPFTLRVLTLPDFESPLGRVIPVLVLVTGLILSFVAFRMLRLNATQADQLLKSEKQLRLVTDSLPALISYLDSTRRYRFNNRAYEEWFKISREEITGRSAIDVIGTRNYERMRPHLDRAMRGEFVSHEGQIEVSDGSIRPVISTYVPDFGPRGTVRGIVALTSDISERKSHEERSRFLAEFGAVLAASLDVETTLNRFASLLTPTLADWCAIDLVEDGGQARRVAISATNSERVAWLDSLRAKKTIHLASAGKVASVIKTGEPLLISEATADDVLIANDQFEHEAQIMILERLGVKSVLILPLKARSRTLGAVTLAISKGERRFTPDDLSFASELARRASLAIDNAQLYSEAQRANRAKDEFLATLSHELRTPMNVILGWLEILGTESVDAETFEQAITTLNRNAQVQIQLINDLLDISRIISGKLLLHMQPTDMVAITKAAIDGILPAARAKSIQIHTQIPTTPLSIQGDADRIQQVLWNLLSNAVKFTPEGGKIEVALSSKNGSLLLLVRDSGLGIDPHFVPYVFDRFRQEDGSTTRAQGGLGIGLSIVRYLMELHGGSISVHSDGRGKGATFTATFPYRQLQSQTAPAIPAPLTNDIGADELTLSGLDILLVDDSPDVRVLISRILGKAGAQVTTVASSAEADPYLSAELRPSLLISDIGLPDEDGFSFIRRVRTSEITQGRPRIPAIALTAYAQETDSQKAVEAGYDCHLPKPVTAQELLQGVAQTVSQAAPPLSDKQA